MAHGQSIHIGLNEVSAEAYGGDVPSLNACEGDAADMLELATAAGFVGKELLTQEATRETVLKELHAAARQLKSGDIFLLSYSGHGSQVVDKNNDEDDFRDETWCLYDGQLIDDELYDAWSRFAKGVRIVVVSDSCHSGTVVRAPVPVLDATRGLVAMIETNAAQRYLPRALPDGLVRRAYRAQKQLYDELQRDKPKGESEIDASVLLISGCQDLQESLDGPINGAFTAALLRVWNEGTFDGSYRSFHRKIQRLLPLTQNPNLMTFGRGPGFAEERPFTIG
jgi:metacaspase-1